MRITIDWTIGRDGQCVGGDNSRTQITRRVIKAKKEITSCTQSSRHTQLLMGRAGGHAEAGNTPTPHPCCTSAGPVLNATVFQNADGRFGETHAGGEEETVAIADLARTLAAALRCLSRQDSVPAYMLGGGWPSLNWRRICTCKLLASMHLLASRLI